MVEFYESFTFGRKVCVPSFLLIFATTWKNQPYTKALGDETNSREESKSDVVFPQLFLFPFQKITF